ncbi:hypothetical protein ON010_g7254 [Phytophthora cinnamomi]|nr:hypothetical protein ON010_g7254 [Phytophthora cinnamomi]
MTTNGMCMTNTYLRYYGTGVNLTIQDLKRAVRPHTTNKLRPHVHQRHGQPYGDPLLGPYTAVVIKVVASFGRAARTNCNAHGYARAAEWALARPAAIPRRDRQGQWAAGGPDVARHREHREPRGAAAGHQAGPEPQQAHQALAAQVRAARDHAQAHGQQAERRRPGRDPAPQEARDPQRRREQRHAHPVRGAAQRAHAQGARAQQQLHLGAGLDAQAADPTARAGRTAEPQEDLHFAQLAGGNPEPEPVVGDHGAATFAQQDQEDPGTFGPADHNQIDDWSGLEALSSLENLRQLNLIGNPIVGKKLEVAAKPGTEDDSDSDDSDDSDDGNEDSGSDSDDDEKKKKKSKSSKKKTDISEEEKQQIKEAKKLDAKHKQYNFKMKRLFPNLVVRDAVRVLDKRVHGYVAPPKEEKKQKQKKPEPSDKKKAKGAAGKRKREDSKKPKAEKESTATNNSGDDDKASKKEKKAHKKHKSDNLAGETPVKVAEAVSPPQPEKKSKHHKKQATSNESTPIEVDKTDSASKSSTKDAAKAEKKAAKEKKRKEPKPDKKKEQRQPKEIASGVVAVKQFKKGKKAKSAEAKPVDLTQLNFTPDVGFGGSAGEDGEQPGQRVHHQPHGAQEQGRGRDSGAPVHAGRGRQVAAERRPAGPQEGRLPPPPPVHQPRGLPGGAASVHRALALERAELRHVRGQLVRLGHRHPGGNEGSPVLSLRLLKRDETKQCLWWLEGWSRRR